MAYKYFHYSAEQLKFLTKIEAKMGRNFKPGVVFNKGKRCSFTELSSSKKSIYSDDKIVAEGEISTFTYTLPNKK